MYKRQAARRGGPDDAERFDRHPAQRDEGDHDRGDRDGHEGEGGEGGQRYDVGGEGVDVPDGEGAGELPGHREESGADQEAEERARQGLAGRDPPGHGGVRADQPQRREPPVALLAAEADGGRDEDEHGQEQDDAGDDHEQDQEGVHRLLGHRPAEALAAPVGVAGVEEVDVGDVPQLGRADEPVLAEGSGHLVGEPFPEQGALGGVEQVAERGGEQHLAGPGERGRARGERGRVAVGLQQQRGDDVVPVGGGPVEVAKGVGPGAGDLPARVDGADRLPHLPLKEHVGQGGGEQQQRHAEADPGRGQQGAQQAGAPSGDGEPGAEGQVAGPDAELHAAHSASRTRPSRTTISRSE